MRRKQQLKPKVEHSLFNMRLPLQKKIKLIAPIIPTITDNARQSELARKAINNYIDGDTKSSLDVLKYVLFLQKDNEKLRKLQKIIGEEIGVVEPSSPEMESMDPVKSKLLQALGLFYEGKFIEVIKMCGEALRLEPGNLTALERLGSAYYKLGQKREAKETWEKAYMLNPDNKVLKKFIDKIEKELQQKRDILNLRIKAIEKQESQFREETEKLREEVLKKIK